jgi:hypothetical protein
MRSLTLCLLALMCFGGLNAQQIHLSGNIIDLKDGSPIASATISVPSKKVFYPADNQGKFDFNDSRITDTDTLTISCMGYQSQRMLVSSIGVNSVIRLQAFITNLNEVRVGFNKATVIAVGSKSNNSTRNASSLFPLGEEAMFMAESAGVKGLIQTVSFYIKDNNGGNAKAPFRVKLYALDADGAPGPEIISDVIIVSATKKNAWFDVDVSGYRIEVPESGFFVSFSLLDDAYYKVKAKQEFVNGYLYSSTNVIGPRLGMSKGELSERVSYARSNSGLYGYEWQKIIFDRNLMIRATIQAN